MTGSAKQSRATREAWIASSLTLLAMTRFASALLPHHRVDAVRPAARGRQIEAGKAEQDRSRAIVEHREKSARKMSNEIGKGHFARQNERYDPRPQADHQKRAEHEFERAGRADQREQFDFLERISRRKFQELGHAILKQQQAGNEAKETERDRLKF